MRNPCAPRRRGSCGCNWRLFQPTHRFAHHFRLGQGPHRQKDLNIRRAGATKLTAMCATFTNALRLLVAVAVGLGFAARVPAGDCGATAAKRTCQCCMNPESSSCCAGDVDTSSPNQPSAPAPENTLQLQPAALHVVATLPPTPPAATVIFPSHSSTVHGTAAGHSFQSVRCIWTV